MKLHTPVHFLSLIMPGLAFAHSPEAIGSQNLITHFLTEWHHVGIVIASALALGCIVFFLAKTSRR